MQGIIKKILHKRKRNCPHRLNLSKHHYFRVYSHLQCTLRCTRRWADAMMPTLYNNPRSSQWSWKLTIAYGYPGHYKIPQHKSRVWWYTTWIPVLGRQRRLVWVTDWVSGQRRLWRETLSKEKEAHNTSQDLCVCTDAAVNRFTVLPARSCKSTA